jgi:hypothetical protein
MLLTNSDQTETKYYVRLSSGQELGPYGSAEQARLSASTFPLREGEAPPQVIPKTAGGQQFLFG